MRQFAIFLNPCVTHPTWPGSVPYESRRHHFATSKKERSARFTRITPYSTEVERSLPFSMTRKFFIGGLRMQPSRLAVRAKNARDLTKPQNHNNEMQQQQSFCAQGIDSYTAPSNALQGGWHRTLRRVLRRCRRNENRHGRYDRQQVSSFRFGPHNARASKRITSTLPRECHGRQ